MNKEASEHTDHSEDNDDMRAEYDFASMSGGVRGKYCKAYRSGHTVRIHKNDGTTFARHFMPESDVVILESDVREYFPDSESVNHALRCLIPLLKKDFRSEAKRG